MTEGGVVDGDGNCFKREGRCREKYVKAPPADDDTEVYQQDGFELGRRPHLRRRPWNSSTEGADRLYEVVRPDENGLSGVMLL